MSLLDEFTEAEHPRGQPGNKGQFAPSPGGGGATGGKEGEKGEAGPNKKAKGPNFRGSLARETKGDTTQPVASLDDLYEKARKAEGPFKSLIDGVAKKAGAEAQYTPEQYAEPGTILKSRKSAERKLGSELGGDPKLLRDVIRATVVGHTVESTRKAAADFIGEHSDSILRVKDRYVDVLKGGYRDILINYRTPEGLVAEVQFNSKNMVKAKNETAHALYEQQREIKADTPEQLQQAQAELDQAMSKIYEEAYQADGNGNGWKKKAKRTQIAADTASEITPTRMYRLSQEDGPTFEAATVVMDGKIVVLTNQDGTWKPNDALSFADLIMPEQALGDWEVTPIEPKPLEDEVEDEQQAYPTRALDRQVDITYFTNEQIGPNQERTPEGFLICYDVPVARVGEMIYGPGEVPKELGIGRDGKIRVQRRAAEVFSPRSMASLNGKPVTDDHPPVDVEPNNWKFYLRGVVNNPRRGEGDQKDFLLADLVIYDQEMIEDIQSGKREVSCGYNPDYLQILDDAGNSIPGRGEQIKIRYNHLALVRAGRCGPCCAIGDRKTVDSISLAPDTFWTDRRRRRFQRLLRKLG